MYGFYLLVVFALGLTFGSFLNVCIYRTPRDLSVVVPRSFCPDCRQQIDWQHNIPVVSYLILRGRCAFCSHRISIRYPLVELLTGSVFVLVILRYGLNWVALKWIVFASLLIVLFFTDLETRLLPDEFTLGGVVAGLVLAVFIAVPGVFGSLFFPEASARTESLFNAGLGALVLALPIWAIGALWGSLRKREALGLGDVKLLAMLGVFLGAENGVLAVMIAAIAGAIVGIGAAFWTHQSIRSFELPFGSFLCAAALALVLIRASLSSFLGVP